MLKGISPLVSPELLSALSRMGHGDELVLGDAHFPAETFGKAGGAVVLRADGIPAAALPMITMEAVPGDELDPDVEASYRAAADRAGYAWAKMQRLERYAFYERAKKAFLVVQTGETRKYGNLILRKGVTPAS